MSFVAFSWTKEDVPRRTTGGRKAIAFPSTGLPEASIRPSACSACPRAADHDVCQAIGIAVPYGETRYQRVPVNQRPTVQHVNELQAALWLAGYCAHGYIGDQYIYNVGESATNASQFTSVEILSASGSWLIVYGENPRRLNIGTSTVNPEWPFEAPAELRPPGITDEEWDVMKYGRLIPGSATFSLPVGAAVEFQYPSVLFQRLVPFIVEIDCDTDESPCEYRVRCSTTVANARRPYDNFFPPVEGKYFAKLRFEALTQARWLNVQAPSETQFSRASATFTTAAVHELLNNAGHSTRVLYPSMLAGALTVTLSLQAGGIETLSDGAAQALLSTTQSPSGWSTTIDLSAFDFGETYSQAAVAYLPQAVAGDAVRLPFQSSCSNAQRDPSGSFVHGDERHCARAGTATQFGTFRDECWQPECSGFALGDDGSGDDGGPAAIGPRSIGPSDMGDEDFWSGLWHRGDWFVQQGIPGISHHRNFSFGRPDNAGASIGSLCGGFSDTVPPGYYPLRDLFFGPVFGRRFELDDGDGNEAHALVMGAFYLAPYDHESQGGDSYVFDWSASPTLGAVADAVSSWNTKPDAIGGNIETDLARLPFRLTGATNVYTYGHGSSAMAASNERHANSEAFVVAMSLATEDDELADLIRARFS